SSTETLRTDFIANVSHELKTPLAVMQNYGTLLQKPGLPEEKRVEYARAVTDASRRLADLISNILKLNKLENQQIFPDGTTYDLSEQLCECLLAFEDIWEKKELEIDTDMEDGIFVKADPEIMSLVWNNLFSNAIKFTENGGKVTLSLKADEDFAYVQVSDTGCGISKEVGMHMFDKFYQGDTSHATQGNGLGLALVKRIMDITGSDISVESELGRGTTFTVKMRRENNGTV
ncbi:MAG: HAMP domain-containing histidine kinase, partial [Lachnospiraceae bacterium]|nr:HAMP domain-containing histidine kinase [Lachnospiraceae bacterium]